MKVFFLLLITIHGLIHTLGFVKAFKPDRVPQLTRDISRPLGLLWLSDCLLFIATAFLYYSGQDAWWIFGTAAILISQTLIILFWRDAKFGTIANIILCIPVIMAAIGKLPPGFGN